MSRQISSATSLLVGSTGGSPAGSGSAGPCGSFRPGFGTIEPPGSGLTPTEALMPAAGVTVRSAGTGPLRSLHCAPLAVRLLVRAYTDTAISNAADARHRLQRAKASGGSLDAGSPAWMSGNSAAGCISRLELPLGGRHGRHRGTAGERTGRGSQGA